MARPAGRADSTHRPLTGRGGYVHMKGLRWTLAFLRDPISALGSSIATICERLAPFVSEMQTRFAAALRNAARRLALAVGAAALALVGAGCVLLGLWPGFNRLLGPIGAS